MIVNFSVDYFSMHHGSTHAASAAASSKVHQAVQPPSTTHSTASAFVIPSTRAWWRNMPRVRQGLASCVSHQNGRRGLPPSPCIGTSAQQPARSEAATAHTWELPPAIQLEREIVRDAHPYLVVCMTVTPTARSTRR